MAGRNEGPRTQRRRNSRCKPGALEDAFVALDGRARQGIGCQPALGSRSGVGEGGGVGAR